MVLPPQAVAVAFTVSRRLGGRGSFQGTHQDSSCYIAKHRSVLPRGGNIGLLVFIMLDKLRDRVNIVRLLRGAWATIRYYVVGIVDRADKHHIFLAASGLSFSLILCSIPLVLVVFSFLGFVLQKPSIQQQISALIDRAIPYQDYASFVENLVFSRVAEFKAYKSLAGVFGAIALVFASSGLFGAMRTVLNTAFHKRDQESIFISKLRDLGLILMVLLYFLFSTAVLPALEVFSEIADKIEAFAGFRVQFIEDVGVQLFSFAVIFIAFSIIYYAVPHGKMQKRVVAVSALAASIMWVAAQQIFGFYISHFVTLKRIYGAYVLVIATALWFFYSSLVFIVAAEIGQLYRERRDHRLEKVRKLKLG